MYKDIVIEVVRLQWNFLLSKLWSSTVKYFKMYKEFWQTQSFPQGNAVRMMGWEGDVLSPV
jgi:hypothetical protein